MDFRSVAVVIKDLLKSRGLTYKMLAKHLGMTESGIKKILNSGDCSYNRLGDIADFLETSISDILSLTEKQDLKNIRLPDEAQEFFIHDPGCFYTYFCILYDKATVKDLEERLNLSRSEVYHYLKLLDDWQLIQWQSNDKLSAKNEFGLLEGSKEFLTQFKKEFATRINDELLRLGDLSKSTLILRYLYCSDETFNSLSEDIQKAFEEYERNAQRDLRLFGRDALSPRKHLVFASTGRLF